MTTTVKTDSIIVATGIRKTYSTGKVKVEALRGVDITITRGEMVAIMGPSGCGKTTLLNCLSGLDDIDEGGSIKIADSELTTMSDNEKTKYRARQMGYIFQSYNLLPVLSALENVELPMLVSGANPKETREKAMRALEMVGLSTVASVRAGTLSLGMSQRLGIAAALIGDPPVLLFDEPVNGLDPEGIHWVRTLMRTLAGEGRTVLVSSHLLSEMANTADRLVVIGRGKLIASTTVSEFVGRSGGATVRVRSPQLPALRDVLTAAGLTVDDGPDALTVREATTDSVGELAAQHAIVLHELSAVQVSLEQAYLSSTDDATEFRGGHR